MLRSYFTEHPQSVGETYWQHMAMAASFSAALLVGTAACFIHAVFPFLCKKTGSRIITELNDRMVVNRARHGGSTPVASASTSHISVAGESLAAGMLAKRAG